MTGTPAGGADSKLGRLCLAASRPFMVMISNSVLLWGFQLSWPAAAAASSDAANVVSDRLEN